MPEIAITVRGSFDSYLPPERATLALTAGFHGPDQSGVFHRTSQATNALTAELKAITNPVDGPVTWWSSARLRTWTDGRWDQDGQQLPLVHHASVGVSAKFRDFDALARFVDQVSGSPGVTVDGVFWALTEARQSDVQREARLRAVADAVARAEDYAAAIGLASVTAVAIADVGMLGGDARFHGEMLSAGYQAKAAYGGRGGDDVINLNPEDVLVSAAVDARFVAV